MVFSLVLTVNLQKSRMVSSWRNGKSTSKLTTEEKSLCSGLGKDGKVGGMREVPSKEPALFRAYQN
jgi:hypothetical protein